MDGEEEVGLPCTTPLGKKKLTDLLQDPRVKPCAVFKYHNFTIFRDGMIAFQQRVCLTVFPKIPL